MLRRNIQCKETRGTWGKSTTDTNMYFIEFLHICVNIQVHGAKMIQEICNKD